MILVIWACINEKNGRDGGPTVLLFLFNCFHMLFIWEINYLINVL